MKQLFLIVFGLLLSVLSFCQSDTAKRDKYKFVGTFDMRNSVVIGHKVKFNGVKIGIGNSKHRFGIGIYGLREPVVTYDRRVDSVDATDTNRYNFGFLSFFYERILYRSKRWEFSAPVHLNLGSLKGEYLSTGRKFKKYLDEPASSITLSVKSHFKVFRWIGLHGGFGYNVMLNRDKPTRKALNAPFYSFGIKIFLAEAWKLTFNKEYRKSPWID